MRYRGNLDELYKGIGNISDRQKAIDALAYSSRAVQMDIATLNEDAKKGCLYLDMVGVPMIGDIECLEDEASYKIIPTQYKKDDGRQICVSFYHDLDLNWEGIYVGTIGSLIESIQGRSAHATTKDVKRATRYKTMKTLEGYTLEDIVAYNNAHYYTHIEILESELTKAYTTEKDDIKTKTKVDNKTNIDIKANIDTPIDTSEKHTDIDAQEMSFYKELYERLLLKENWGKAIETLRNYIRSLKCKVRNEIQATQAQSGQGYILNKDKNIIVINTGLLDKYCMDIYFRANINMNTVSIFNFVLINSKSELINYGFDKESIKKMPAPIKFYTDASQLIFDATIEDFDLEDTYRLDHIIQARRERFPKEYRDTPIDVLAGKIVSGIKRAIRISERDYKYIVPMYNIKEDCLQFLMPLYLDNSVNDAPELAMVVGEQGGFYKVFTILDLETAYSNARLISPPNNLWLQA